MKNLTMGLALALTCIASNMSAQIITENRNVDSFSKINGSLGIEILIGNVESSTIRVETDQEIMPFILTEVRNGQLRISYTKDDMKHVSKKKKNVVTKVYLSSKSIEELNISTGATVKNTGIISGKKIKLSANTGGQINLQIDVDEIDANSNTAGWIKLSGDAKYAKLNANTGGNIEAKNVKIATADVSVSTGSSVDLTVSDSLSGNANTGGSINYYGSPSMKVKANTGGSINKKN